MPQTELSFEQAKEKLQQLDREIPRLRTEKAKVDGAIQQILRQIQQEFEVDNVEEIPEILRDLQKQIEEKKARFMEVMNKLTEEFEW